MPATIDVTDLIAKIEAILKREFTEESVVDVSSGFRDNIHVVVVSKRFTDMSEKEKEDALWTVIDQSELADEEKYRISLILPYSPRELK